MNSRTRFNQFLGMARSSRARFIQLLGKMAGFGGKISSTEPSPIPSDSAKTSPKECSLLVVMLVLCLVPGICYIASWSDEGPPGSLSQVAHYLKVQDEQVISRIELLEKGADQSYKQETAATPLKVLAAVLFVFTCLVVCCTGGRTYDHWTPKRRKMIYWIVTPVCLTCMPGVFWLAMQEAAATIHRRDALETAHDGLSLPVAQFVLQHFAALDTDNDGFLLWKELRAGTDSPQDSVFEYVNRRMKRIGHVVSSTPVPESAPDSVVAIAHEKIYGISRADLETYPERLKGDKNIGR